MLKALIECFDQAGIQVKASKLIFGVREISFHNYTISKDQTRPKDENLCPIRNMSTPRSVTELKAFLGCTQQMSQYFWKVVLRLLLRPFGLWYCRVRVLEYLPIVSILLPGFLPVLLPM